MTDQTHSQSESDTTKTESAEGGDIRERVNALQEKASHLNAKLDQVQKNLQEAAGETRE